MSTIDAKATIIRIEGKKKDQRNRQKTLGPSQGLHCCVLTRRSFNSDELQITKVLKKKPTEKKKVFFLQKKTQQPL